MSIKIENVELSKNSVQVSEQISLAVTIVHHSYLSHFRHSTLHSYTHAGLNQRGESK